jgi:hypothetical protein
MRVAAFTLASILLIVSGRVFAVGPGIPSMTPASPFTATTHPTR